MDPCPPHGSMQPAWLDTLYSGSSMEVFGMISLPTIHMDPFAHIRSLWFQCIHPPLHMDPYKHPSTPHGSIRLLITTVDPIHQSIHHGSTRGSMAWIGYPHRGQERNRSPPNMKSGLGKSQNMRLIDGVTPDATHTVKF